MKLTTLTLITFILVFNCKAQSPILPLIKWHNEQTNAYYKDLNNELDDFVGTWHYTNGNTSLKMVLKIENMYYNGRYYQDLIVGEYQYIEDGIEKTNTLSDIDTVQGFNHKIEGNWIQKTCFYLPVSDCEEGESRLDLILVDPITQRVARLILHKRIINNQTALRAIINFGGTLKHYDGDPPLPSPIIPSQEYVFIKQ